MRKGRRLYVPDGGGYPGEADSFAVRAVGRERVPDNPGGCASDTHSDAISVRGLAGPLRAARYVRTMGAGEMPQVRSEGPGITSHNGSTMYSSIMSANVRVARFSGRYMRYFGRRESTT